TQVLAPPPPGPCGPTGPLSPTRAPPLPVEPPAPPVWQPGGVPAGGPPGGVPPPPVPPAPAPPGLQRKQQHGSGRQHDASVAMVWAVAISLNVRGDTDVGGTNGFVA